MLSRAGFNMYECVRSPWTGVIVVSYHLRAGNWILVSGGAASVNCWIICPGPTWLFFFFYCISCSLSKFLILCIITVTLNFWSFCLYLPNAGRHLLVFLVLCGDGDWTQGFVHASLNWAMVLAYWQAFCNYSSEVQIRTCHSKQICPSTEMLS